MAEIPTSVAFPTPSIGLQVHQDEISDWCISRGSNHEMRNKSEMGRARSKLIGFYWQSRGWGIHSFEWVSSCAWYRIKPIWRYRGKEPARESLRLFSSYSRHPKDAPTSSKNLKIALPRHLSVIIWMRLYFILIFPLFTLPSCLPALALLCIFLRVSSKNFYLLSSFPTLTFLLSPSILPSLLFYL